MQSETLQNSQYHVRALSEASMRTLIRDNGELLNRLIDQSLGAPNPDDKLSILVADALIRDPALLNSVTAHATGGTVEDASKLHAFTKALMFAKCLELTKAAYETSFFRQVVLEELVLPTLNSPVVTH